MTKSKIVKSKKSTEKKPKGTKIDFPDECKGLVLVEYKIEGISPLLMHKFSEETYNQPKSQNNNLTPREIAEKYAYRIKDITKKDSDNELYIPGEAIYACLIQAGRFHKLGKVQITVNKRTILPAGCILMGDGICKLGTTDFEVDSRPAVNNAINARIMTYRPRLDKWETSFVLQIDPSVFPTSLIDDIVVDAGRKCGLLSFRPLNKGWFGRFKIVSKIELTK